MAVLRNTAEGQANGTNLTTGNSGGGSGDAFDSVAPSGTITKVFSNAQSMRGAQSYLITPGATSFIALLWNANDTTGSMQAYAYFTAYPTTNYVIMTAYNSGSGQASLGMSSNGRFLVTNKVATVVYQSALGGVLLNTWLRWDMCVTVGGTTSTGRIQASLSLGDNPVPFESYDSGFTTNTDTSPVTSWRFGKQNTAPDLAAFYIDEMRAEPGATTLMPPPITSTVAWFGM